MAIAGLSELRRLPRLGNIRLGIKVKHKNGKEYPKEVDYFILDPASPSKEKKQELISSFQGLYGAKPKRIKIMFPLSDKEKFFPQYWKRYGLTTSLKCIGDGQTAVCISPEFSKGLEQIGKTETDQIRVVCEGKKCIYHLDAKGNVDCGMKGTLQVLLPEILGAGVWQITTSSFYSIVNLNSCIDTIEALCGRFYMVPLVLERRPQEIIHKGKKTIHHIMHVDMNFRLIDIQKMGEIDPSKIMLQLPEPTAVEPEDIADSDEEVPTERIQELKSSPADSEPKEKPIKKEAQVDSKEEAEADPGKNDFLNFMVEARANLKKLTGNDKLYTQEMEAFSVQYPSEVKEDDTKIHMIAHFKSLIVELRKKVNERRSTKV